jgi:serine/threonine-protein phosphatase Stp1
MAQALQLATAVRWDRGRVRRRNEDRYLAMPEHGLWAVADGVGGHGDGAFAAHAMIQSLGETAGAADLRAATAAVRGAARRCNTRLRRISEPGNESATTLVTLVIRDMRFVVLWAGDSRAYLQRGDRLLRLTTDHNFATEMVARGEIAAGEAALLPLGHLLSRAVGTEQGLSLDRSDGPVLPGDRFLLCTDGLTSHLLDEEIAERLGQPLENAADALLGEALARGGRDNITLVLVEARA